MTLLKKYLPHIILPCFLMIAMSSCTTSPKSKLAEYNPALEKIIKSDMGAFRGFNLGDKADSIKVKEQSAPIEADQGYLYYEFKIDDTTGSYSISYNFDEKGLNEIQSDVFISNASNTEKIFNAFKSYFDDRYGESELDMGYNVWTVKSENYGDVKINLSDESTSLTTDKAPGKISIWIYPDKN